MINTINKNWFQVTNNILNGILFTPPITHSLRLRQIKKKHPRSRSLQHNFKYQPRQEVVHVQRPSKFLSLKSISQKVIKRNSRVLQAPPVIENQNARKLSCYCSLCGQRSQLQLKHSNLYVGIAQQQQGNRKSTKRSMRHSHARNTSIGTPANNTLYRADSIVSQLSEESHIETREPPRKKKTIFLPKNYQFQLIRSGVQGGSIRSFEEEPIKESIGNKHLKQLFYYEKLNLMKSKQHFEQKSLNLLSRKTEVSQVEDGKGISLADFKMKSEQKVKAKKKNWVSRRIKCQNLISEQNVQMEMIYSQKNLKHRRKMTWQQSNLRTTE